jgi:hypothetical protein
VRHDAGRALALQNVTPRAAPRCALPYAAVRARRGGPVTGGPCAVPRAARVDPGLATRRALTCLSAVPRVTRQAGRPLSYPSGHPLPLPVVHTCRGPAARTPRQHGSTPRSTPLPSKLCVPRSPYKGPPLLTGGALLRFSGRRRRAPPQAHSPIFRAHRPFPAITREPLSVPARNRCRSPRRSNRSSGGRRLVPRSTPAGSPSPPTSPQIEP